MAQPELNLLEVSTGCAAELGAGPPHIMGGKLVGEPGLPGLLGHDVPDQLSQPFRGLVPAEGG